MTLNASVGQSIVFSDPIASNTANGLVPVAVNGPGTVVFKGGQTSAIAANTTVSGSGVLLVNDNATVYGVAGNTMTVNGTLGGTGTVTGTVTNNGTVAPGGTAAGAIGALTINGNYAGTGAVAIKTASGGVADVLHITGDNTGAINIKVTDTSGLTGTSVKVAQVDGAGGVGAFALQTQPLTATAGGVLYTYGLAQGAAPNANSLYLQVLSATQAPGTAIPTLSETTLALLALLLAGGAARRLRRGAV